MKLIGDWVVDVQVGYVSRRRFGDSMTVDQFKIGRLQKTFLKVL